MDQKSFIFISSVVTALIFSWLFIWPAMQSIDSMGKMIEQERGDLAILQETQKKIEEQVNAYTRLSEENKELLNLAVPDFADQMNLAVVLNEIAEVNGLIVNNITISAPSAGAAQPTGLEEGKAIIISSMPAEIDVEGKSLEGYESFKSALNSLEETLRIFDITSISITPPDSAGIDPEAEDDQVVIDFILKEKYKFTVSGKAYFINQ